MGISTSFDRLSQALECYESAHAEIQRVEAARPDESESNEELRATVDIAVPLCSTLRGEAADAPSPTTARIRDDGGLQVDFPASTLPTADRIDDDRVSVEGESARVEDGTILVTSVVSVAADSGTKRPPNVERAQRNEGGDPTESGERTDVVEGPADERTEDVHRESGRDTAIEERTEQEREVEAARNEELPPYEDTEYLRTIYASCDTFVEMADVIEMDVAAETVRRYMTEADVHEPSSYDTASGSDDEDVTPPERDDSDDSVSADENAAEATETDSESSPVDRRPDESAAGMETDVDDPVEDIANRPVVADGIGLPDGLTVQQLADAVESSRTLHEVKRKLDIERDQAQQLMERLNLLDLVVARLSERGNRRISRSEIADRIRQSVTDTP
ncbi:hypothetical protein DMJ13_11100 [halophilic archaeon]|nr:hypothetical protein DMJ13_11100 [halophilic archaeon]